MSMLTILILSTFLVGCSSNLNRSNEENSSVVGKSDEQMIESNQDTNKQYYFTANEGGSITKINMKTNDIVETIEVDGAVHNVQVSPNGKILGATVVPEMNHGEHSMEMKGQAIFFDTETNKLLQTIDVGNHPAHIVFTGDGKYALVTNSEENTVVIIDMDSFTVKNTVQTGKGPHGFRISKNSKRAYIANMNETTISVVNLETMKEEKKIEVGLTPVTTAITSDEKTLVTTLNGENVLAIVDLATEKIEKIPVGNGPAQVYIDGNNQYAYVANQGTKDKPSNSVSIINLGSKEVTATLETGKGAHGIVTSSNNKHLFVTNMFDNSVTIIDTEEMKVLETIQVGEIPNGISVMN